MASSIFRLRVVGGVNIVCAGMALSPRDTVDGLLRDLMSHQRVQLADEAAVAFEVSTDRGRTWSRYRPSEEERLRAGVTPSTAAREADAERRFRT